MPYIYPADILLPKNIKDNWAVIACDQFTSEKKYWDDVKEQVGSDVSTYNLILPEIFLEDNADERIKNINATMSKYLENDVFDEYKDSMMFVSRLQDNGVRLDGIVCAISLSDYEYTQTSNALVRASEKTVIERIPARINIRKDAPLEFPHILLLVDDEKMSVVEPVADKKDELKKVYDLKLMLGGGSVQGYLLDKDMQTKIESALGDILNAREDNLLFAVGDGNHSLASAKECAALSNSENAQYALVEIVNIHSDAIQFEPIYRVLFGCESQQLLDAFTEYAKDGDAKNPQKFTVVCGGKTQEISIPAKHTLPVGSLQVFLDEYLLAHPEIKIDYIHGEDSLKELCKSDDTVGFLFEGMKKQDFFASISADGSLPRKTFSLGHAQDKRYYVEGRKIK